MTRSAHRNGRSFGITLRLAAILPVLLLAPSVSFGQGRMVAGTPRWWDDMLSRDPVTHEWPWGELFFDHDYATSLRVDNECASPQVVRIHVGPGVVPYVNIPASATIPAKTRDHPVPMSITLPPPPDLSGQPLAIAQSPHLRSGFYLDLAHDPTARIHVSQGAGAGGGACSSDARFYAVTGHIHVDPDPADDSDGSLDCLWVWNTGQVPSGYDLERCVETFRDLALHYRDTVLGSLIAARPDAWSWFPDEAAIPTMDARALLAAKSRADLQRTTEAP